jgi:hypothetical protein
MIRRRPTSWAPLMPRASWFVMGLLLVMAGPLAAQDLEPRAYSASPIGANFVAVSYVLSSGSVITDPTLPVTDVEADVNALAAGLGRTFSLAGRQALVTAALPYGWGNVEGDVGEDRRRVERSGLTDSRCKLSINLHGSPARTPKEFAQQQRRSLLVGTSVTVSIPTGQYVPERLINLGTNRWGVKPEVGLSYPWKKFYFDAYSGVWFFTKNSVFYPGESVRRQDPLTTFQAHVSYTVRQGMWLAFDSTWYGGGSASVDGGAKSSQQNNTRLGATASLPLFDGHSAKIAYSGGASVREGSNFRTVLIAWQFLWF